MSTRKRKLTRDERKQIEAAIARAKGTDKKELSAQDSIPYQRMFPDGICRVTDTFYTKTVQFQDINYQLSQNEDKTAIFEGWSDFLNYFDSSIRFQDGICQGDFRPKNESSLPANWKLSNLPRPA